MNFKRIIFGTIFGAISGVICIIGMVFLNMIPAYLIFPYNILYLVGGIYNRIIMGILIGFAEDLKIIKEEDDPLNSLIRGLLMGALVSTAGFFYGAAISFFLMGLLYGALTDLITTYLSKEN